MGNTIIVNGAKELSGTITLSGSKNLALALIPASLLIQGSCILKNIPEITDVFLMIKTLNILNVRTYFKNNTLEIDSSLIKYTPLMNEEMGKLRASHYFMGLCLVLFNKALIKKPGGCSFEKRPINYHLDGFKALGVEVTERENYISLSCHKMHGANIDARHSVGTTINIAMASSMIDGDTFIFNYACEPEVVSFLRFLEEIGTEIEVTEKYLKIHKGTKKVNNIYYHNQYDRIEAGTFAVLGAMCGKNLIIKPFPFEHMSVFLKTFEALGVNYEKQDDAFVISQCSKLNDILLETNYYPSFPTDLQQPLCALLASKKGTSIIEEKVYLNRFSHVDELMKMGAVIHKHDNVVVISGVKELHGTSLTIKDLRCGACLVLASLVAKGQSIIDGYQYVERGYDNFIKKLQSIGADIHYVK